MSIRDMMYAIANNALHILDIEQFNASPDLYLMVSVLKSQALSINIMLRQYSTTHLKTKSLRAYNHHHHWQDDDAGGGDDNNVESVKDSHLTKLSKQTEKQQVLSSPYLHYQFYSKQKENNLSNSFLLFFNTIDANKLVSQINSFVELNITKA
jgi:hypothetical protein